MFTILDIATITNGTLIAHPSTDDIPKQTEITNVHFDSRKLTPQSLFVALTEGKRDGHDFIKDAKQNGAAAALISHEDFDQQALGPIVLIKVEDTLQAFQKLAQYYRQKLNIPVIAITGSNGKTTTKDMVAHLLSKKFNVFKTHKNLNNHIGLPLSLLQIEKKHEMAVLELGMNQAGEIDRLAHICQPTVSMIINIGEAHIENLGSKENIAKAKGELLPHTDPQHYVLLNADDSYVTELAPLYPGHIYVYSTQKEADIYTTELSFSEKGSFFTLHIDGQQTECYLPMHGEHNVSNLLPGVFIAYQTGMSLTEIQAALLDISISDMRFEIDQGPNESIIINDAYNASPTSMRASIHTFEHLYPERKKVLVLGDMYELGPEAERYHLELGAYLQTKPFAVITVGDLAAHISSKANGKHAHTQEEAQQLLQPYLNDQYALLFKGSRGMKLENLIHTLMQERHPD